MLKIDEIKKLSTERTIRQFGVLFLFFALVVAGIQWQRGASLPWSLAIGGFGTALCLASQITPQLVRPLFIGWMILLIPINWIVSHTILAAMFFLVFTPIGFFRRLLGADALLLKKPNVDSYWQTRTETTDKRCYLRQY
jgi:hypothetical protein